MGTETKKMAKTITTTGGGDDTTLATRGKGWTDQVKDFYSDVRNEMRKVTTPSTKEVQATTMVVVITVFIFAAYFWGVDQIVGKGIEAIFKAFQH